MPRTPSQKKQYDKLNARLAQYVAYVQRIYATMNIEAAKLAASTGYDGSVTFSWKKYPQTAQRLKELQNKFVTEMATVVLAGTSDEWKRSNQFQDLVADKVLKAYHVERKEGTYTQYYRDNSDALKAFQSRRDRGMNLSDKLWEQSKLYKQELEDAIGCAIERGTDAITLSKQISKYLQDFPSMQKDYRAKFGTASKAKDCEYRSIRLARSEINMAYRTAEQKRWQQFDFVVGYEIKLSGSHPKHDVCDTLAGKYPKDFVWTGWHPNDLCYCVPILKTKEEFFETGEEKKIQLISGSGNPEITDKIEDYNLPKNVRNKIDSYYELDTYNKLKLHFESLGISLETDVESLHGYNGDKSIDTVIVCGQKFAVAIDSYREVFGSESLSKLKRIVLKKNGQESLASYYYNAIGEDEPLAGSICTRNFTLTGQEIFHELAHAVEDSFARGNEDAVLCSKRIANDLKMSDELKAYFGASRNEYDAERIADALSYGFTLGSKRDIEFIDDMYAYLNRGNVLSVNSVIDVPESFKNWCNENMSYIDESKERGTLPYCFRDNLKYIYI